MEGEGCHRIYGRGRGAVIEGSGRQRRAWTGGGGTGLRGGLSLAHGSGFQGAPQTPTPTSHASADKRHSSKKNSTSSSSSTDNDDERQAGNNDKTEKDGMTKSNNNSNIMMMEEDELLESAPPAGTRFTLSLDDEEEEEEDDKRQTALHPSAFSFIKDVLERPSSGPPVAPVLSDAATNTGFPAHTKRTRQSAFRRRQEQQQTDAKAKATLSAPFQNAGYGGEGPAVKKEQETSGKKKETTEKELIDEENKRRMDEMSPEEIEKERKELFSDLSPELLQMFLKRANLDDREPTSRPQKREAMPGPPSTVAPVKSRHPVVSDEVEDGTAATMKKPSKSVSFTEKRAPPSYLSGISPDALPPVIDVHFPTPRQSRSDDLDPSSPAFLTQLHQKYFPNLPTDPTKLAWMQTPSAAEKEADPYSPYLPSVLPSALRFDFQGRLLPPRLAREIPHDRGLHHHGDAPLSAGYTLPELSHLARSSFPAQRCMAIQTLGKVMYKLGTGVYSGASQKAQTNHKTYPIAGAEVGVNDEENDVSEAGQEINKGLWRCLHQGRVVDGLQEAANGGVDGRGDPHLGVRSYAVEALWLWQKGGGESWKAD